VEEIEGVREMDGQLLRDAMEDLEALGQAVVKMLLLRVDDGECVGESEEFALYVVTGNSPVPFRYRIERDGRGEREEEGEGVEENDRKGDLDSEEEAAGEYDATEGVKKEDWVFFLIGLALTVSVPLSGGRVSELQGDALAERVEETDLRGETEEDVELLNFGDNVGDPVTDIECVSDLVGAALLDKLGEGEDVGELLGDKDTFKLGVETVVLEGERVVFLEPVAKDSEEGENVTEAFAEVVPAPTLPNTPLQLLDVMVTVIEGLPEDIFLEGDADEEGVMRADVASGDEETVDDTLGDTELAADLLGVICLEGEDVLEGLEVTLLGVLQGDGE